jgi:hypothetical protein
MEIKHNGNKIQIYDSIEDLPADRFNKYNRGLMIDAGIGSDIQAFNDRINAIRALIDSEPKKAKIELSNMQNSVLFVMSNTHPEQIAFCAVVKRVDGKDYGLTLTDLEVEEIHNKILEIGLPIKIIRSAIEFVKKNRKRIRGFF